jgi:hypothetical protein
LCRASVPLSRLALLFAVRVVVSRLLISLTHRQYALGGTEAHALKLLSWPYLNELPISGTAWSTFVTQQVLLRHTSIARPCRTIGLALASEQLFQRLIRHIQRLLYCHRGRSTIVLWFGLSSVPTPKGGSFLPVDSVDVRSRVDYVSVNTFIFSSISIRKSSYG